MFEGVNFKSNAEIATACDILRLVANRISTRQDSYVCIAIDEVVDRHETIRYFGGEAVAIKIKKAISDFLNPSLSYESYLRMESLFDPVYMDAEQVRGIMRQKRLDWVDQMRVELYMLIGAD